MSDATVMITRRTFDGETVQFWTDGVVTLATDRLHNRLVARGLSRELCALIADDVSLYDAAEIKLLIKAARSAHAVRQELWGRSADVANKLNLRPIMRAHAARFAPLS